MKREQLPVEKMMAYLDGELSRQEAAEFRALLDQHPEWRAEFEEMAEVVGATKKLKLRAPDPHTWDHYWEQIDSRLQRQLGWVFWLLGAAILIVLGAMKAMTYADNDFVRAGVGLIILGTVILFTMVVRGRLKELPKDRYRRIRK